MNKIPSWFSSNLWVIQTVHVMVVLACYIRYCLDIKPVASFLKASMGDLNICT